MMLSPEHVDQADEQDRLDLIVSSDIDSIELTRLLRQIARESCDHSWKNFGLTGDFEALLSWENKLRPTWIFFYYLATPGKRCLVASATVAESICGGFPYNKGFPHIGFPVLGRCYIMPEFREQGFYRKIMEHRLQFCRKRYKSALKAIHMGSSNVRVMQTITSRTIEGWPNFIKIGSEALKIDKNIHLVDAFILFTPTYAEILRKHLNINNLPIDGSQLQDLLERVLKQLAGTNVHKTAEVEVANNSVNFNNAGFSGFSYDKVCQSNAYQAVEQLLSLCRAIPLIGFEKNPCKIN